MSLECLSKHFNEDNFINFFGPKHILETSVRVVNTSLWVIFTHVHVDICAHFQDNQLVYTPQNGCFHNIKQLWCVNVRIFNLNFAENFKCLFSDTLWKYFIYKYWIFFRFICSPRNLKGAFCPQSSPKQHANVPLSVRYQNTLLYPRGEILFVTVLHSTIATTPSFKHTVGLQGKTLASIYL